MVNLVSKIAIISVVFFSILYQFIVKSFIFDSLGYGRKVQSIKDFNHVRCEKIAAPGLEACEDMWLHEPTGFLYMACSTSHSRTKWLPAVGYLDASKRSLTDRIAMLDTRGSGPAASRLQWLKVEDFPGNNGDGSFNLLGVAFLADKSTDNLRILLVNDRPSIDPATGKLLDSSRVGANSTIEHFRTKAGSSSIQYVRTHAHPLIKTPNSVKWVSDHSFVLSNSQSEKVGFRRSLDPLIGGGNVVYCDRNRCKTAFSGLTLPNGVAYARDGLIYVADTRPGNIHVFSLTEQRHLKQEDEIHIGLPLDNLSIDTNGDIFAAAFPKAYKWWESSTNPSLDVPSAVFRISRTTGKDYGKFSRKAMESYKGEYTVEKIMEDDGSLLPGSTAVVHDPQTGRIFLSSIMAFAMVCETR